jgi:hypothetical protein
MKYMITTTTIVMTYVMTLLTIAYWMITIITSTFYRKAYTYCSFITSTAILGINLILFDYYCENRNNDYVCKIIYVFIKMLKTIYLKIDA